MTDNDYMPSPPTGIFVQSGPSDTLTLALGQGTSRDSETWTAAGTTVSIDIRDGVTDVRVAAARPVSRIALRWADHSLGESLVLGDAWERSYGELQWRHVQPERLLPWYWAAYDEKSSRFQGRGVVVRSGALCSWTVDSNGYTLWLDVRSGAEAVRLGDRQVTAARLVGVERLTSDAWGALSDLVAAMTGSVECVTEPIVGANSWYSGYGKDLSPTAVLNDARMIVDLSDGHLVRPFSVIDDGWNPGEVTARGPWNGTAGVFDEMAGTAAAIREVGARPGIWFRPMAVGFRSRLGLQRPRDTDDPAHGSLLDPSIPEVLDQVEADVSRFRDWGFDLIKYDFSTLDILGRPGYQMGAEITADGWHFSDQTRTTAEIIVALYERVRAAADDRTVIGCNTIGHLAAGLVDVQRTGDDVSGRDWERTRRMGVNTLAFRLPQHGNFFVVDADCVPCTPETNWEFNRQFLDLIARSGSALFVSVDHSARTANTDNDMSAAIRLALDGGLPGGIRPLDWMTNTAPTRWHSNHDTVEYTWDTDYGSSPFRLG